MASEHLRKSSSQSPAHLSWVIYVCPICNHAGSTTECAGPNDPHDLISRESGRTEVVPLEDLVFWQRSAQHWRRLVQGEGSCDEEAIERVAAKLCEQRGWTWGRGLGEQFAGEFRVSARELLLAAAEAP